MAEFGLGRIVTPGQSLPRERYFPMCYLAQHGELDNGDPLPSCEGRVVRCHLLKQQELDRRGLDAGDPATYVLGCGGLSGAGGHHALFDKRAGIRRLILAFADLPLITVEWAERHGLVHRLEDLYGPRE